MDAPIISFKRGDSFRPSLAVTTEAGAVQDITGWEIISQVRDRNGKLVATLDVSSRVDASGTFVLAPADEDSAEANWPVGDLEWDVEYTDAAGLVRSTETITIRCLKDISRA